MGNDEPAGAGQALRELERFVVENEELLSLEMLIGRFNIFDALSIARYEIRHSNFLAFLLDPAESHGQGQVFLKALLMDLLRSAPAESRPLSPIELDGTDLRRVEVRREWKNIDLLIVCDMPAFVVAVENKVDSGEHSDQLARYQDTLKKEFPGVSALYIFLTTDGLEASEDSWVPYSYRDIHRVLSRVRKTHGTAIGDDVRVFLDHYLNLIGTRFMNDAKIDELCRRIYTNHRQALELIYDRARRPGAGVLPEVEDSIRNDGRWHVFSRSTRFVDFVPRDWTSWWPAWGTGDGPDAQAWLLMVFELMEGQLSFFVVVGTMKDAVNRQKVLELLLRQGHRFGFKRKGQREPTSSFTRVSSREKILSWGDGEEPTRDEIERAVKPRLDALWPNLAELPDAIRALLP